MLNPLKTEQSDERGGAAPMNADDGLQGAGKVQGAARSMSALQWLTWIGGTALFVGLLALAAVAAR
jgi:hypothetical protein